MVELDHQFTSDKGVDHSWAVVMDLEKLVPCVEGGSVTEKTGPESVKAEIKVKMGAMSMKFKGTVEVVEADESEHRALLRVKSREQGGQGHANADVAFTLNDWRGQRSTRRRRSPARPRRWAREWSRPCSTP